MQAQAFLEITLSIPAAGRGQAAGVYGKYRQPFLDAVPGAVSKNLLIRDEDVQVLHGFRNADDAAAYLGSDMSKMMWWSGCSHCGTRIRTCASTPSPDHHPRLLTTATVPDTIQTKPVTW